MPNRPPTLLLTRPEPQARAFLETCETRVGAPIPHVIAPVIEILPVHPPDPISDDAAVIFTSARAVEFAGNGNGRAAFCVGDRTADTASAAGFRATSANGDADALVALILRDPPASPLLHIRGEHTRGDIVHRLRDGGLKADDLIVYRQVPRPFDDETQRWLASHPGLVVPLFSPMSAAVVASSIGPAANKARLVAISDAALSGWSATFASAEVAASPNATAMAVCVARHYVPDAC